MEKAKTGGFRIPPKNLPALVYNMHLLNGAQQNELAKALTSGKEAIITPAKTQSGGLITSLLMRPPFGGFTSFRGNQEDHWKRSSKDGKSTDIQRR